MDVVILPLTEARWPDLEAVFRAEGCSLARGCWCMYYRESGKVTPSEGLTATEDRRERAKALAGADPPAGLLAYADGVPVGWVAVAPRPRHLPVERRPFDVRTRGLRRGGAPAAGAAGHAAGVGGVIGPGAKAKCGRDRAAGAARYGAIIGAGPRGVERTP